MSMVALDHSLLAGAETARVTAAPDGDVHQAAQEAVNRALDSAQRLITELRTARFAALARHAREGGR